jgi:hypothetical protein
MMNDHLSRLEDRIQWLVEGGFARLFAEHLHPRDVATRLIRAMEDALLHTDGEQLAPDVYLIRLNPEDQRLILDMNPDLTSTLGADIVQIAKASGYVLARTPQVKIVADHLIVMHQVAVSAVHSDADRETTQSLNQTNAPEEAKFSDATAFLIMGDRHIPIDRAVLNLGRHRDNHLIIDDPNVSRHHAQIRLRFERHVIFDLGSSSGTLLNGQRIEESTLKSGDVIGLATTSLIYYMPDAEGSGDESLSDTDKMSL